MQYEPIKALLGKYSRGSRGRKILYALVDILLLRAWHIRKELKTIGPGLPARASILDAGSGMGQYSWRLAKMSETWEIEGIDINSAEVDDCSRFFSTEGLSGRVSFRTGDLQELEIRDKYDFIITVDVMEHIPDDNLVFLNFYNSLRENGVLLISTPSDQGGSDAHDDNDASFIDEHVRNGYGLSEISSKLSQAGFRSVNARYTYGWPGKISWKISMKYPVMMLNKSWLFFILLPFWYIVFFPFALVLNLADISINHTTGTGLLVTARK